MFLVGQAEYRQTEYQAEYSQLKIRTTSHQIVIRFKLSSYKFKPNKYP